MSRHPWTHAADFIRILGPIDVGGVVLSRADASAILSGIAEAMGIPREELAIKLSEAEQRKTEADRDRESKRFVREWTAARALSNIEGGK